MELWAAHRVDDVRARGLDGRRRSIGLPHVQVAVVTGESDADRTSSSRRVDGRRARLRLNAAPYVAAVH